MNASALPVRLGRFAHGLFGRRAFLRRSAPLWLGLLVTVGSAIPPAERGSLPLLPRIPVTFAGYPCSSHSAEWPTFTGYLSNSTGTKLAESTSGDVYGRISNVESATDLLLRSTIEN